MTGGEGGGLGGGGDDEYLLQMLEVDGRFDLDALEHVVAPFVDAGDGPDDQSLGETTTEAGGDEEVADLNIVGEGEIVKAHAVAVAATDRPGAGPLDHGREFRGGIDNQENP